MPKITLTNSVTGHDEDFEPVDAREILSNPDTIYKPSKAAQENIGMQADGKVNIPQLQGGDAEMQVGLSIEKYGRADVVKAQIGNPVFKPVLPMSTTGKPLDPQSKSGDATANRPLSTSGKPLESATDSKEATDKSAKKL